MGPGNGYFIVILNHIRTIMKAIKTIMAVLALGVIIFSCEKDELHITGLEEQLAKALSAYRDSMGLNTLAHNYDVLSREAKGHAEGRANGSISESQVYEDMQQRWIRVYDKWGINNVSNHENLSATITGEINSLNVVDVAKSLVWFWAADSIGRIKLLGDYTVQGPGEAKASDGTTYVMEMMCKFQQ
jgi:hypothetical protein